MPELPTLLVSRRPRQVGVDWTRARSWLGGAPRLGGDPWPKGKDGRPLHFAAQIDFAEVAAQIATESGPTSLPAHGSLAFFIGDRGAVIHVPEGQGNTPTLPPAGTPDLTVYGGSATWRTDLSGRPLYPFWPLDFTVLHLPPPPAEDADDEVAYDEFAAAQAGAVERHFTRRQYNLSPDLAFTGPPIPDWWQTAIQLAGDLAKASASVPGVIQRAQGTLEWARGNVEPARSKGAKELREAERHVTLGEAKLVKLHQSTAPFQDYAAEVGAWVAGRDPWALIAQEDMTLLESYWARNTEFPEFTGYHGIGPVDRLKDKMFKALPGADHPGFAALPDAVRTLINTKRAPHPHWWHSAIHYAKGLDQAVRIGIPRASKSDLEHLEAARKKLAQLRPGGAMGALWRMVDGKSKEIDGLETHIASTEGKIAERRTLQAAFQLFVEETAAWVKGRDPWGRMDTADIEQLTARLQRAKAEFDAFVRFNAPTRIDDLETATLLALATAGDRGYATLPEHVRWLINRHYLLPPNCWHQMFGRGIEIQGDSCAMREEGYVMLLQLTYDDMMHWDFGDNGAYQFWISPQDLAKRNWGAARMTFECH